MKSELVISIDTGTHIDAIGMNLSLLLMAADGVEFTDPSNKAEEKGLSQDLINLKNDLFRIVGVKRIFFSQKSITIIKTDAPNRKGIISAAKRRIHKYPF